MKLKYVVNPAKSVTINESGTKTTFKAGDRFEAESEKVAFHIRLGSVHKYDPAIDDSPIEETLEDKDEEQTNAPQLVLAAPTDEELDALTDPGE